MTLRELKSMIDTTPDGSIPNAKKLRESGSKIVAHTKKPDVEITVFQSGYAIYRAEGRESVIRADKCKDYTYYFAEGSQHLPEDYFLDQEYGVLLALAAEDQLEKNLKRRSDEHVSDSDEINDIPDCSTSLEESAFRKESFERVAKHLTTRQKAIYRLFFEQGYTTREIAEYLNITHQAVECTISLIREKFKKFF